MIEREIRDSGVNLSTYSEEEKGGEIEEGTWSVLVMLLVL